MFFSTTTKIVFKLDKHILRFGGNCGFSKGFLVRSLIPLAVEAGPYHPHPGNMLQKMVQLPATKTEASFEGLSIFPTKY